MKIYNILSSITQNNIEKLIQKKYLCKILWYNSEKKLKKKKDFQEILRVKKAQKNTVTWILGFKDIVYLIYTLKIKNIA